MRYRQLAFVALCSTTAIALAACGSDAKTSATTPATTAAPATSAAMATTAAGSAAATTAAPASSGVATTVAAVATTVGSNGSKVIAISFPNGTKQDAVLKEFDVAKATAKEMGYTIVIDDPGTDQQKQINTMDTWIQQGVAAIIAQPVAPETIEAEATKARKAGIKWITYADAISNQDATLGFDHVAGGNEIGKAACDYVKANLGGTAKAALLTYEKGAWAQKRREGIEQGLASCGATITVVAKQDALSQTEGITAMGGILQANPDVNVVLAVEETATEGAYQALLNAGRSADDPKLFLAGIDGTKHALELIQQGTFYRASAALSLSSVGKGMVTLPDALIAGKTGDYLVPLELVTSATPELLTKYITDLG
jgi:ribose transport system substrate-binding protein